MASRKRYVAYLRSIKTLPDFGWTEKHYFIGSSVHFCHELNGCKAENFIVIRPNGKSRKFSTTEKTFAQVYQEMTDYALGKED
jgi:hypothetical protein